MTTQKMTPMTKTQVTTANRYQPNKFSCHFIAFDPWIGPVFTAK